MKETKLPLIKWSGSKRKQAVEIVDKFPQNIETYYEPFIGGGSVLHELLHRIKSGKIKCNKIICSDINKDLIGFWNAFLNDFDGLFEYYKNHYETLVKYAKVDETPDKRQQIKNCQVYYYEERERYNNMSNDDSEKPYLFFWITRNSFNGLIRYNKYGKFNAPYHVGGKFGITPEKLKDIFNEWKECLDNINIEFRCASYEDVLKYVSNGDLIYMDPPYINTTGLYFHDRFDINKCCKVLEELNLKNIKWLMSMDGKTGDKDITVDIPEIYKRHLYISSGQSNFRKLNHIDVSEVLESLYINY